MIRYGDLLGQDLRSLFRDRNWKVCQVGTAIRPQQDDLFLGFEGWKEPDIALDPRLPLDTVVQQLGLKGAFWEVKSSVYLNLVNGDCALSHAAWGLLALVAPGGTLTIRCMDTVMLAKKAISFAEKYAFEPCLQLERFCFRHPIDTDGILFQRNFMSPSRIQTLLAGEAQINLCPAKGIEGDLPSPNQFRLESVSDAAWATSEGNSRVIQNSLQSEWPKCTCCNRLATRVLENRSIYSRYCKDHYYQARIQCDKLIREAFMFEITYRKG